VVFLGAWAFLMSEVPLYMYSARFGGPRNEVSLRGSKSEGGKSGNRFVQGYLAHKKPPPTLGPPWGPRLRSNGGLFLMSEVPM